MALEYSYQQAADAAGVSKSKIARQVKAGEISKNANGKIDPSELARLYPNSIKGDTSDTDQKRVAERAMTRGDTADDTTENKVLQVELDAARQLAEERERELHHRDVTIGDLRDRLDRSERKRDEVTNQLTALLTDQRETTPTPAATPDKKPVNYPLWALVIGLFGVVIWFLLGQSG